MIDRQYIALQITLCPGHASPNLFTCITFLTRYPLATLVTVWGQNPATILECIKRIRELMDASDLSFKDLSSQESFKLCCCHNNIITIWAYLLWNKIAASYLTNFGFERSSNWNEVTLSLIEVPPCSSNTFENILWQWEEASKENPGCLRLMKTQLHLLQLHRCY